MQPRGWFSLSGEFLGAGFPQSSASGRFLSVPSVLPPAKGLEHPSALCSTCRVISSDSTCGFLPHHRSAGQWLSLLVGLSLLYPGAGPGGPGHLLVGDRTEAPPRNEEESHPAPGRRLVPL